MNENTTEYHLFIKDKLNCLKNKVILEITNNLKKELLTKKELDKLADKVIDEISIIIANTDRQLLNEDYIKNLKEVRVRKKKKAIYAEKAQENSPYNRVIKGLEISDSNYLIEQLNNEIDEWANNKDEYYSNYKYALKKTKRFKNVGLKEDMSILFSELLIKKLFKKKKKETMLNTLAETPVDTTNSSRYKIVEKEKFVYEKDEIELFAEISYKDIKNKSFAELAKKSGFKILNGIDLKVMAYIMRVGPLLNPMFFYNGELVIPVTRMTEDILGYRSKKDINMIIESVLKLSVIQMKIKLKKGARLVRRPLYRGDFVPKKEEESLAIDIFDIIVSKEQLDDFIQGNTIDVFVETSSLNNKDAEKIIFNLQKQRMIHYYQNKKLNIVETTPYKIIIDYRIFETWIIITNKNKSANKKRIKDCLDAIKKTGQILTDYILVKDKFIINFLPFSQEEIEELNKRTEIGIRKLLE